MDGTISRQLKMGVCALAAVGLFVATQGCSSSSDTGTGGSTGGGGKTGGQGGTTGGGLGGSANGTGGALALCTGIAWTGAPKITDFSDAAIPDGGTGIRIGTQGGAYGYDSNTHVEVLNGALHITGTYPPSTTVPDSQLYVGFGLYFDSCIDASAYSGVSFKLSGSFGNCDMLSVGASFPQDQKAPNPTFGTCLGTACYGPGTTYTVQTMSVTFASMGGGMPVATVTADAKSRLDGINFGYHSPVASDGSAGGCTVDVTLDDVAFTP